MSGAGTVVALTYRSAADDPPRFRSSKNVGPWAGLTPFRSQSGNRVVPGGITRADSVNLRRTLCHTAAVMINRGRSAWLGTRGTQIARRRGRKRAMAALARRIAVILHHIWAGGAAFRWEAAANPWPRRKVRLIAGT
ncbi:transposase [Cribrihabitans pelagius]|uniref:transposase n=1 Tax=Cribrihabitans pelagius TaxID=1765746 RepID=UPI003B5AEE26